MTMAKFYIFCILFCLCLLQDPVGAQSATDPGDQNADTGPSGDAFDSGSEGSMDPDPFSTAGGGGDEPLDSIQSKAGPSPAPTPAPSAPDRVSDAGDGGDERPQSETPADIGKADEPSVTPQNKAKSKTQKTDATVPSSTDLSPSPESPPSGSATTTSPSTETGNKNKGKQTDKEKNKPRKKGTPTDSSNPPSPDESSPSPTTEDKETSTETNTDSGKNAEPHKNKTKSPQKGTPASSNPPSSSSTEDKETSTETATGTDSRKNKDQNGKKHTSKPKMSTTSPSAESSKTPTGPPESNTKETKGKNKGETGPGPVTAAAPTPEPPTPEPPTPEPPTSEPPTPEPTTPEPTTPEPEEPVDCEETSVITVKCNAECDRKGKATRTYHITTPAQEGGKECKHEDGETVEFDCDGPPCPGVNCTGEWSPLSACDAPCGEVIGNMTREYHITQNATGNGTQCEYAEGHKEYEECTSAKCPVPCIGGWSDPVCNAVGCGKEGFYVKTYRITQAPKNGGTMCPKEEGDIETLGECKNPDCSVNCEGDFEPEGPCVGECGGKGVRNSYFTITKEQKGDGSACEHNNGDHGPNVECDTAPCPVPCAPKTVEATATSKEGIDIEITPDTCDTLPDVYLVEWSVNKEFPAVSTSSKEIPYEPITNADDKKVIELFLPGLINNSRIGLFPNQKYYIRVGAKKDKTKSTESTNSEPWGISIESSKTAGKENIGVKFSFLSEKEVDGAKIKKEIVEQLEIEDENRVESPVLTAEGQLQVWIVFLSASEGTPVVELGEKFRHLLVEDKNNNLKYNSNNAKLKLIRAEVVHCGFGNMGNCPEIEGPMIGTLNDYNLIIFLFVVGGFCLIIYGYYRSKSGSGHSLLRTNPVANEDYERGGGVQMTRLGVSDGDEGNESDHEDENKDQSAVALFESVLLRLGIPSYGAKKYTKCLSDNYISKIDQLRGLDTSDWKRLGLPSEIEEAIRAELTKEKPKKPSAHARGMQLGGPSPTTTTASKAAPAAKKNRVEDEEAPPEKVEREAKKVVQKGKPTKSPAVAKPGKKKSLTVQPVDDGSSSNLGRDPSETIEDWPELESAPSRKSKAPAKGKQSLRDKVIPPSTNITQLDTKVFLKNSKENDDEDIDQLLESLEDGDASNTNKSKTDKSKLKAPKKEISSTGSWENDF